MNHTSILQFRTANCKNCYKCIRNCPVKAIKVTNQQAQIIEEQCILCEKCIAVCPQHAKVEHNDIPDLQKVIASGKRSSHPYIRRILPDMDGKALMIWNSVLRRWASGRWLMQQRVRL